MNARSTSTSRQNRMAAAPHCLLVLAAAATACSADATSPEPSSSEQATAQTVEQAPTSFAARKLPDTPGGAFASDGRFILSYQSALDFGDATISFVQPGDVAIAGDWNGDGITTPGVVRGNRWILADSNSPGTTFTSFIYGDVGDVPVVGDWDGNGTDTPGVVRGTTWFLRNSNSYGNGDISFVYGSPGDVPVAGDWNGDGIDTPGVVRDGSQWFLRNSNSCCNADIHFTYGATGMKPVVGDWDGDGIDTAGMFRDGTWYLINRHATANADATFPFGAAGFQPVSGHWIPGNPLPYQGGPLVLTPTLYLILYGNWFSTQRQLINQFFHDLPNSPWWQIITNNYRDGSGRSPAPFRINGIWVDAIYSQGHVMDWQHIAREVDNAISQGALRDDPNGVYMVLESPDLGSANATMCGAHTMSDSGRRIAFGVNPGCTLNSDCAAGVACVHGACADGNNRVPGCIDLNTSSSPNGDVGVDALFSILAHELAETVTDPVGGTGYYQPLTGNENGDICNTQYGSVFHVGASTANMSLNGHNYLVQTLFNPRTNFCALTP